MSLTPPAVTDWVMDSGASNHMTPDAGNISLFRPPHFTCPSSIVVGNGSTLPVTATGDAVLPGTFRLNNVLVAPNIIKNLIPVRQFTTDNNCSVEFDPFGLSVKDLHSRNEIIRCNSSGPLYSLIQPTPSSSSCALIAAAPATVWHRRLGHRGHERSSNYLVFLLFHVLVTLVVINYVMLVNLVAIFSYHLATLHLVLSRISI